MRVQGQTALQSQIGLSVARSKPLPIFDLFKTYGLPNKHLNPQVNQWRKSNMVSLVKGIYRIWAGEKLHIPFTYGALYLSVIRPTKDISDLLKEFADTLPDIDFTTWAQVQGVVFQRQFLGLAGTKVVTDDGVDFIVDAFQNSVEIEDLKYHGIGTGSTAENQTDSALVTELTTEYTGNVRATGTTTEGASTNIYRTVGTNTLDGTPGAALREHGIFDQAATGGGTLLDRTVYAAITLSSGDALQSTYDLTLTAGS